MLHVGGSTGRSSLPRWPWEVGLVAFEIAAGTASSATWPRLPDGLEVHVLPTGQQDPPRYTDLSQFRYRERSRVGERIARAAEASARYLEERGLP